jgi:radical SAM protein with 4Fe4S-binding SPASM domain
VLRTPCFPAALEIISIIKKRGIHLNWAPAQPPGGKTLLEQVQEAYQHWQDIVPTGKPGKRWKINGIVTAAVLPGTTADIPLVLTILKKMGFSRIYNDYWCYQCRTFPGDNRETPPRYYLEMINNHRYPVERKVPHTGHGFVDYFPIARRLISSCKNYFGCAAGMNYAAVAPDGKVYACHGVIDDPRYVIGAVTTGIDNNKVQDFDIRAVSDRPGCSDCWGRYICGGGSNLKDVSRVNSACAGFLSQVEHLLAEYEKFDLNAKNIIRYMADWTNTIIPHRDTYVNKPVRSLKPRLLTVHGRSMWPLLKNGNKVTVAPIKPGDARFGDIICFDYPPVCHRIIAKFNWQGEPAVLEKGDHTGIGTIVPLREVTGKVVAINKATKTISMETPLWHALGSFIASLSLAIHAVFGLFLWIWHKGRL